MSKYAVRMNSENWRFRKYKPYSKQRRWQ
uniref:Uncharacterized protein n=1 Tax=Arundo donax TaxID=35708 RepID=A0A0A9FQW8_ARUDO